MKLGSSRHFRMDAPGNLLLTGEYAITEPGGVGLCLAPELRAFLVCRPVENPQQPFGFRGIWPGGGLDWTAPQSGMSLVQLAEHPATPPLLSAIFQNLDPLMPALFDGHEIELDSSAFFQADGRKLGFGSSAATCLLLCAAFTQLQIWGLPAKRQASAWAELPQRAVESHRRFQGGAGSGYDILCSYLGGVAIFTGGATPRIRPAPGHVADSLRSFCLINGPAAVRSGSSIGVWRAWRDANTELARAYQTECADLIDQLENDPFSHPFAALRRAKTAGSRLGQALGISADLTFPPGVKSRGLFAKAVGAGNETGIVIGHTNDLPFAAPGQPIFHPAVAGLRAEPILAEGRGQAKLLLFGEHVALWGWPAVGLALPQACTIRLLPGATDALASIQSGQAETDILIRSLIQDSCSAFGLKKLPPGRFELVNSVSLLGGYGSSAALSVAITRMLSQLATIAIDAQLLWQLSNRLDELIHGKASGIDTGISLTTGIQVFHPIPAAEVQPQTIGLRREPLLRPLGSPDIWLVHAAIPRRGSTKSLVAAIAERLAARDAKTQEQISCLGQTSLQAITALSTGQSAHVIAELTNQAQALLGGLGVSSPELDDLLDLGRKAGALGGKLSGAGGGGAFFLVCPDQTTATQVATALQTQHCPAHILSLPVQKTP